MFKDGKFVSGPLRQEVAGFIGQLRSGNIQLLPPEILMEKWSSVLTAAKRFARQLPESCLTERAIANRVHSIRWLSHHIFRICEASLETVVDGIEFASMVEDPEPPREVFRTGDDLARYGEGVITRLQWWWNGLEDKSCVWDIDTYYGKQMLHLFLERGTWHSAHHTRQLTAILERMGIEPDGRLTADDLAGLPLPEKLWA